MSEIDDLRATIARLTAERDEWREAYKGTDHAQEQDEWQRERESTCGQIEALRAALAAQDARLRAAEDRVWPGVTFGCDAPDHLAEAILGLRAERDEARMVLLRELETHPTSADLERALSEARCSGILAQRWIGDKALSDAGQQQWAEARRLARVDGEAAQEGEQQGDGTPATHASSPPSLPLPAAAALPSLCQAWTVDAAYVLGGWHRRVTTSNTLLAAVMEGLTLSPVSTVRVRARVDEKGGAPDDRSRDPRDVPARDEAGSSATTGDRLDHQAVPGDRPLGAVIPDKQASPVRRDMVTIPQALLDRVMNGLESDELDDRRAAFEAVQDWFDVPFNSPTDTPSADEIAMTVHGHGNIAQVVEALRTEPVRLGLETVSLQFGDRSDGKQKVEAALKLLASLTTQRDEALRAREVLQAEIQKVADDLTGENEEAHQHINRLMTQLVQSERDLDKARARYSESEAQRTQAVTEARAALLTEVLAIVEDEDRKRPLQSPAHTALRAIGKAIAALAPPPADGTR